MKPIVKALYKIQKAKIEKKIICIQAWYRGIRVRKYYLKVLELKREEIKSRFFTIYNT